jgi:hypothetical protein
MRIPFSSQVSRYIYIYHTRPSTFKLTHSSCSILNIERFCTSESMSIVTTASLCNPLAPFAVSIAFRMTGLFGRTCHGHLVLNHILSPVCCMTVLISQCTYSSRTHLLDLHPGLYCDITFEERFECPPRLGRLPLGGWGKSDVAARRGRYQRLDQRGSLNLSHLNHDFLQPGSRDDGSHSNTSARTVGRNTGTCVCSRPSEIEAGQQTNTFVSTGSTEHMRYWQVNRIFRDVIVASPLVQHRIDLFSVGLEYNAVAGVSLTDSQEALLRYRSNPDPLCQIENIRQDPLNSIRTTGGVHAALKDGLVRLFTLSSPSRGIQHREWKIPLPVAHQGHYCFFPGADVIAFLELQQLGCVHLPSGSTLWTHSEAEATCG